MYQKYEKLALSKVQVILAMQLYQSRYNKVAPVLERWMKKWPCLNVFFFATRVTYQT